MVMVMVMSRTADVDYRKRLALPHLCALSLKLDCQ